MLAKRCCSSLKICLSPSPFGEGGLEGGLKGGTLHTPLKGELKREGSFGGGRTKGQGFKGGFKGLKGLKGLKGSSSKMKERLQAVEEKL